MPHANQKFSREKRDKVIKFVRENGPGFYRLACREAGIGYATMLQWKDNNVEGFGDEIEEALEVGNQKIVNEMWRRAIEGWEEPVFQKGRIVGHKRVFDTQLLQLLAKSRMPERFREQFQVDHQHKGGVLLIPGTMSGEEALGALEDLSTMQNKLRDEEEEKTES